MNIPKEKIQNQMSYFFRQLEPKGHAGLVLAWALLKDWVDHYDDGTDLQTYENFVQNEIFK